MARICNDLNGCVAKIRYKTSQRFGREEWIFLASDDERRCRYAAKSLVLDHIVRSEQIREICPAKVNVKIIDRLIELHQRWP